MSWIANINFYLNLEHFNCSSRDRTTTPHIWQACVWKLSFPNHVLALCSILQSGYSGNHELISCSLDHWESLPFGITKRTSVARGFDKTPSEKSDTMVHKNYIRRAKGTKLSGKIHMWLTNNYNNWNANSYPGYATSTCLYIGQGRINQYHQYALTWGHLIGMHTQQRVDLAK